MFGERLRPKLQRCKFLQKGFCIAVLSVSSSQQSGQSRCVASTRALLQILLSHDNLTRQEERRGTEKWGWQRMGGVLCNICRVTEYQRKDGRRKDGRRKDAMRKGWKEKGWKEKRELLPHSPEMFPTPVAAQQPCSKKGKEKQLRHEWLVNRCHFPPWNPLFSVSSTCSCANARLPEDGMSQTWRGEHLHFPFPCASKLTCGFTWASARHERTRAWFCESVCVLANRQITSLRLNMLVSAFVRLGARLLLNWRVTARPGWIWAGPWTPTTCGHAMMRQRAVSLTWHVPATSVLLDQYLCWEGMWGSDPGTQQQSGQGAVEQLEDCAAPWSMWPHSPLLCPPQASQTMKPAEYSLQPLPVLLHVPIIKLFLSVKNTGASCTDQRGCVCMCVRGLGGGWWTSGRDVILMQSVLKDFTCTQVSWKVILYGLDCLSFKREQTGILLLGPCPPPFLVYYEYIVNSLLSEDIFPNPFEMWTQIRYIWHSGSSLRPQASSPKTLNMNAWILMKGWKWPEKHQWATENKSRGSDQHKST